MVGYCTWPPLVNSAGRAGADGADGACSSILTSCLCADRPITPTLQHNLIVGMAASRQVPVYIYEACMVRAQQVRAQHDALGHTWYHSLKRHVSATLLDAPSAWLKHQQDACLCM